jgi:hypothetical protein
MLTSTDLNIDRLNVAVEPRNGTRAESAISFVVVAAIVAYWIRFLKEVDGCMILSRRGKVRVLRQVIPPQFIQTIISEAY